MENLAIIRGQQPDHAAFENDLQAVLHKWQSMLRDTGLTDQHLPELPTKDPLDFYDERWRRTLNASLHATTQTAASSGHRPELEGARTYELLGNPRHQLSGTSSYEPGVHPGHELGGNPTRELEGHPVPFMPIPPHNPTKLSGRASSSLYSTSTSPRSTFSPTFSPRGSIDTLPTSPLWPRDRHSSYQGSDLDLPQSALGDHKAVLYVHRARESQQLTMTSALLAINRSKYRAIR